MNYTTLINLHFMLRLLHDTGTRVEVEVGGTSLYAKRKYRKAYLGDLRDLSRALQGPNFRRVIDYYHVHHTIPTG